MAIGASRREVRGGKHNPIHTDTTMKKIGYVYAVKAPADSKTPIMAYANTGTTNRALEGRRSHGKR
jgi:hypothetical protein